MTIVKIITFLCVSACTLALSTAAHEFFREGGGLVCVSLATICGVVLGLGMRESFE
jgi:hypothetical protein